MNEVTLLDIRGMVEGVIGDIYLSVEQVKSGAMSYADVVRVLSGVQTDDILPFNWENYNKTFFSLQLDKFRETGKLM